MDATPSPEQNRFHIFTVGWDVRLIDSICTPLEPICGLAFTHGLIWGTTAEERRDSRFILLGLARNERVPPPDYRLLASLECEGVPTVRTMILGDRVLRNRPEGEALGYMTLLAGRLRDALLRHKPDLVLGSFDQAHGMLGLAVAKSAGIPWVTMSFSVIPENLVGFCRRLTPNSLITDLGRPVDSSIRQEAREVMGHFRSRKMKVFTFRPATTLWERVAHLRVYAGNLASRALRHSEYNKFVFPTIKERISDIVRRSVNAASMPASGFRRSPGTRKYVFFPLQMKPEMSTETQAPFYQDQVGLIRQLSDAIPIELDFVVKLHLSDPDNYSRALLLQLMRIPGLRIAHPSASSFPFLERASLVIGITGTPCLEAALLGKPVLIFGDSPYLNFPCSERAESPDEYHRQIRRMLELPPPGDEEILEAFAAYVARYMRGRVNDWERPIDKQDLSRLADCFRKLRSFVEIPANRANWYQHPSFVGA